MYKTGSLLLVSILAVALLVAPSASSQSQKLTLNDVAGDVIRLQSYVKEMQNTADKRNAEIKAQLDQVTARFSSIDASLQKLGSSLEAIKTADEASQKELQQARATLNATKDYIEKLDLGQALLDVKNGMKAVRDEVRNIPVPESSGPTSRQVYDAAWGLLNQGFYDDAIAEFKDFVRAYPKDSRTPRASLNIGTAYSNLKKFDQAVEQFDLTLQTWPESDVKCVALYKKGLTLVQLNKPAEARLTFQAVQRDCPNTDEAKFATEELAKRPAAATRGGRGQ